MPEDILAVEQPVTFVSCAVCEASVVSTDSFCEKCGYPLQGSEEEQAEFNRSRVHKHLELDDMQTKINSASNTMLVLAGVFAVFGLVYYNMVDEYERNAVLITNLVLSVLYVGLGFWSRKQPVAGIVSALALYIIVQIFNAIENPATIVSGMLIKIFIIMYLVKGLKSAFEAKRLKELHNL